MLRTIFLAIVLCSFLFPSFGAAEVEWERLGALPAVETPVDVAFSQDGRWIYLLSAEHHVLIFSTENGKLTGTIPVAEGVVAIAVSANGERLFLADRSKKIVEALAISFAVKISTNGSPFIGPARAPVEIVVFSDFQCPYCAKLVPILEEIEELYPQEVKVVFKNFPLPSHAFAKSAALAALAAGEQGRFWEFHDMLFENSSVLNEIRIVKIAEDLGLDMKRFTSDKKSPVVRLRMEKDIAQGNEIGLNSTPVLFVNGRKVRKRNVEEVSRYVKEELAKLNAKGGAKK